MEDRSFLSRVAPVLVLVGGLFAYWVLSSMGDEAEVLPPSEVATAVDTLTVRAVSLPRKILAQGTVVPAREVDVRPQVSGRVVYVHPDLKPGARFDANEVLLRIERNDYELAVSAAAADVRRAAAELELEKGRRKVAEAEWSLFEDDLADIDTSRALATREPQLAAATAMLASAEARLDGARLNLARTEILAPFDATVLTERVADGQTVGPETVVAQLAATDAFWVRVSLPLSDLAHVSGGPNGSTATVELSAGDYQTRRVGQVVQTLTRLEQDTRLARAIVEIADPLSTDEGAALLLGSYVSVSIEAAQVRPVVELPASAVSSGSLAYLYRDDDTLEIREIDIAWRDEEVIYVESGLVDGDEVVLSRLGAAIEGQPLSRRSPTDAPVP